MARRRMAQGSSMATSGTGAGAAGVPSRGSVPGQRQPTDRCALRRGGLRDVHGDIHAAALHRLHQPRRPVDAEPHPTAGAHRFDGRGQQWQELVGGVLCGAEGDRVAVDVEQGAYGLVVDGEDTAGLFQQQSALRGEPHAPALALDDGPAQGLLQPADVLADRGLTQGERLGRAMEAAVVGDRGQAAQRHDVEDRLGHTATVARTGHRSPFLIDHGC